MAAPHTATRSLSASSLHALDVCELLYGDVPPGAIERFYEANASACAPPAPPR